MSYSKVLYTASGGTATFAIPFDYIDEDHIEAYVDGVEDTTLTFPTTGQVTLSSTPTAGAAVLIKRSTPKTTRLVDFEDSSIFSESDLDLDSNQAFYLNQETLDELDSRLGLNAAETHWDAESKRITNLANGSASTDAATVSQVTSLTSSAVAAAEAAQTAAETAETNAETAAATATSQATIATTKANEASASASAASASAAAAAASAASVNMPSATGNATKYIRQKADETGFEYRTAAQTRSDIGLGSLATLSTVGASEITNGSVGTDELADDNVTFAKIQNITDARLLGRSAGSNGDCQEITVGSGLSLAAGSLSLSNTPGLVLLASATANNSTSVDFTSGIDSTYDHYIIGIDGLKAATDQTNLLMRVYDATLADWQSDAADYQWAGRIIVNTNEGSASSTGDSSMNLTTALGTLSISNADPYRAAYQIHLFNPSNTTYAKNIMWDGAYRTAAASNYIARIAGAGTYIGATNAITGVRFLMSSGNITAGNFYLYGVKKS
jgi:hypothetical protein